MSYLEQNKRAEWREGLVFCQPCGRRGVGTEISKKKPTLKRCSQQTFIQLTAHQSFFNQTFCRQIFCTQTSPNAHNIATTKVAVIFNMFNGHLKRGNKAPFCSRNAFNSDFDYFTRLKSVHLETRPSLFEENYHLKPKWFSLLLFSLR